MKKLFTLIAVAALALGANAQTVINLAGLQTSDFTYDEAAYETSTWTDSADPSITAPAFTKKGTNVLEALTLTGKNVAYWYKAGSDKTNFFILCNDYFTVGGKGAKLVISNAKAGQTITLNVAAKADYTGTVTPVFSSTNASMVGEAPVLQTKNEFVDVAFTVSENGDVTIEETAKGYNIKSITIADGEAVEVTEYVYEGSSWTLGQRAGTTVNNSATYAHGGKLEITGKDDKAFGAAKDITAAGKTYKSIKLSNGAQNTLTMPEGKTAKKVTFYSYINKAKADAAEANYWAEVNSVEYKTKEGAENPATLMKVYTDTENYQTNPDVISFDLADVSSFTFTNKGDQPCVVIIVSTKASTDGITNVKSVVLNSNIAYNLSGQKVGNDYKGVVIINGKKMLRK